jgi:hypothetical protein
MKLSRYNESMITKSLHYKIPAGKPFDQANWFETFVGSFVVPLVATGHIAVPRLRHLALRSHARTWRAPRLA